MTTDPFKTAEPIAKKLKILLYGATGTGKTIAATSFPRSAYIDAEGGSHLYRGRKGFEHIKWLDEKTLTGIERAVSFIAEDGGKNYDTLVIDPITVIYDVLKEATAKTTKYNELGFREWAKINNRMNALYTMLTNLPVHVIGVCRESDIYETINNELKRTGVKPDADKDVRYIFDFEIRMMPDHSGVVGKSRGVVLGENGRLKEVHWGVFEPIANMLIIGETKKLEDKESASVREASEIGVEPPTNGNSGQPTPQNATYPPSSAKSDAPNGNGKPIKGAEQFPNPLLCNSVYYNKGKEGAYMLFRGKNNPRQTVSSFGGREKLADAMVHLWDNETLDAIQKWESGGVYPIPDTLVNWEQKNDIRSVTSLQMAVKA